MVSFPYCNLLFHLPAALFCLWSWLVYALKTATSCLNFRQKEPRGFVLQLKAHLGSLWLDVPVPLPMQTTSSSALSAVECCLPLVERGQLSCSSTPWKDTSVVNALVCDLAGEPHTWFSDFLFFRAAGFRQMFHFSTNESLNNIFITPHSRMHLASSFCSSASLYLFSWTNSESFPYLRNYFLQYLTNLPSHFQSHSKSCCFLFSFILA